MLYTTTFLKHEHYFQPFLDVSKNLQFRIMISCRLKAKVLSESQNSWIPLLFELHLFKRVWSISINIFKYQKIAMKKVSDMIKISRYYCIYIKRSFRVLCCEVATNGGTGNRIFGRFFHGKACLLTLFWRNNRFLNGKNMRSLFNSINCQNIVIHTLSITKML